MTCDQLEQTVVSVSHVYRHFGATDCLAGRVYWQMSVYVKLASRVVTYIRPGLCIAIMVQCS